MKPDPTLVSYWDENESNQLTLDEAIRQAPNESVRNAIRMAAAQAAQRHQRQDSGNGIPEHEKAAFEKLKYQIAEAQVTQRATMIAGGEAGIAQKARVAESWTHSNIHRQQGAAE